MIPFRQQLDAEESYVDKCLPHQGQAETPCEAYEVIF
jgi:hypothetical protein